MQPVRCKHAKPVLTTGIAPHTPAAIAADKAQRRLIADSAKARSPRGGRPAIRPDLAIFRSIFNGFSGRWIWFGKGIAVQPRIARWCRPSALPWGRKQRTAMTAHKPGDPPRHRLFGARAGNKLRVSRRP